MSIATATGRWERRRARKAQVCRQDEAAESSSLQTEPAILSDNEVAGTVSSDDEQQMGL